MTLQHIEKLVCKYWTVIFAETNYTVSGLNFDEILLSSLWNFTI